MRKTNKYKIYKYLNRNTTKLSLRVLKFRRPKWAKIQKYIKYKKDLLRSNFSLLKKKIKFWDKLKKYYKMSLLTKKQYSFLYEESFSFKKLNKKNNFCSKKEFLLNLFVKPEYQLDILLWNLYFTNSVYKSKKLIENRQLFVNNKLKTSVTFLKRGDIVNLKPEFLLNLSENINKYLLFEKLLSFVEVDYYSCSFIIIKDVNQLSFEDLYLFIKEDINLDHLSSF